MQVTQIDWFSVLGGKQLIQKIQDFLENTNSLIPATLENTILLFAVLLVLALGLGFVFRLFFGKKCIVNRSISGFLEILFIYAATVAVYVFRPWNLAQYLAPLPFAIFHRDVLIVSLSACSTLPLLCAQLLSLIILCFIVHVLNAFLPSVIAESAPVALVAVLAVALAVSLFNPLLCVLATVANPVIGLLYTFFFSNTIGKNLTRAVLSAALLCILFYGMDYYGFSVISIQTDALLKYSPFALALLGVWYVYDSAL